MTTTSKNMVLAVRRLREIKDNLKPLKAEEKTLTATIKGSFEVGQHVVGAVPFSIVERETLWFHPLDVKAEFPRKLQELFEFGVFKVDAKKFEDWAATQGWDISNLRGFSYTKVLNI